MISVQQHLTLSLPQAIIIGFCKQHRSRWDGSMSRLIWIYAVWHSVFQLNIWTSFQTIVCWNNKRADDKCPLKFGTERVKELHFASNFLVQEPYSVCFLTFTILWQIQPTTNWWYFIIFPQKTRFHITCKLSPLETICMKCRNLLLGKMRKKYFNMSSAENLPRVLSVKL